MGVDTKGVMVGSFKDTMAMLSVAEGALNHYIATQRRQAFPGIPSNLTQMHDQFRTVSVRLVPGSEMAQLTFTCNGEQRTMSVFFGCDCDNVELGPKSVSLSLGCSGNSVLYAALVLHAFSLFGQVYLDENDCDDVDPAPLGAPPLSLLQAVQLGYVSAYQFEKLAEQHRNGTLYGLDRSFQEFVGMNQATLDQFLMESDHSKRWAALEAYSHELPAPHLALQLQSQATS